jgi:c(7)-type cytochrome triheme protein
MIIALLPVACTTISDQSEEVAKPATVRLKPKAPSPAPAAVPSRADHLLGLPPAEYGNRVDWVQALETGKIEPKGDISGEGEPDVLELDIVMPVKASVDHVRFSHEIHTQWLTCDSCHAGLFEMEQGASEISKAKMIAGENCGVCHGSVAFPIEDCKRCHNVSRDNARVE